MLSEKETSRVAGLAGNVLKRVKSALGEDGHVRLKGLVWSCRTLVAEGSKSVNDND